MKTKREKPTRGGGRRTDATARKAARRPVEVPPSGRARPRRGTPTAPARESRVPRTGPQTTTNARPTPAKNSSQAKARAKARKAKAPKVVRPPLRERLLVRLSSIDLRPRTLAAKVPFVVLVIGALGVGLGITLWLSTDSAERSYQLGNAREENRVLLQQKEALERAVLEAEAAPALAEAAQNLGMIPTRDTAHLVQDAAGNWVVVGTPKPAEGAAPPPLNTRLPDAEPTSQQRPPVDPAEVPVLVSPGNNEPTQPATSGPEILLRAPDGATTLGTEHLPVATPDAPGAGSPTAESPGPAPTAVPPAGGTVGADQPTGPGAP